MFIEEKITPGIVCKLSANDMKCLGISNRSDMMALRMECVLYGNADDECQSIMPCRQFEIPKQILEDLLNADFKISDISKMLSISESTVYRRNMMALRMECVLYGNADDECQSSMPCRQFEIPKQILEDLLDADFKISDISKMLSISESTVYRRMRQFELSKMTYSDVDSHVVEKAVKEIVSNCGERTIQQLLGQQHIKSVLDILIDIYITALHYVFLPKINGKLQVWQQAWAGHRIRTVKSSPIRLFTAGLLNSPVEMALDFPQVASNETESRDEEGSPRPIFSSPLVFVNDNCKSELHLDIPKHWESSNFGVDIFLKAIAIIQKHIENS
ncbi:hypothetical protein MAR_005617 [Mya arenaria]|uniref:Integrase core domain-containing protein n=1 Tax=Mya arenaria TaxID=6604 RepID=A0ABY7F1N5_MYAAR|nr:hypothetical protein MAR_005617 [Mya arenaria]